MFADLAASLRSATRAAERERGLFPLPIVSAHTIAALDGIACDEVDDVREYLFGVVVGLNRMYGFRGQAVALGGITSAQRAAHDVIIVAALDFHRRLVASFESRVVGGWSDFEDKGEAPRLKLIASAVAVPDCATTCDPATLICWELGSAISDANSIFPLPPPGLDQFLISIVAIGVSTLL